MSISIKKHIPKPLRRWLRYNVILHVPLQQHRYQSIINRVAKKGHCNVLFIASSLPMWRYDGLCRLLINDSRFSVRIALIPFSSFNPEDRRRDISLLSDYFAAEGLPYEVVTDFRRFKRDFRPDLIFYPQPYCTSYEDTAADWGHNRDCLLAHAPYSLPLTELEWYTNIELHNVAWRYYVASSIHQNLNRRLADNHGKNTVVVGEPHADQLTAPALSDPWKQIPDGKKRKRLIWAPHFSVVSYNLFDRPDFNWSYKVMLNIAREYADRLQIVFKPHPRLKSELYKHPDWGKERTDEFYRFWETSPTTQLQTGEYIDLFKTSDAMVHNCGSFTGEYLWMHKPVAYIARDIERIKSELNDFGAECQDAHYLLQSEEDIRRFVDEVVLGGNDPMESKRNETYRRLMQTPDTGNVAQNMFNDLIRSLGL